MTEEITFVLYIPESESCSDVLLKKKKNTYQIMLVYLSVVLRETLTSFLQPLLPMYDMSSKTNYGKYVTTENHS